MKDLLKLFGCWVAFIVAMMTSGIIGQAFHLAAMNIPHGTTMQAMFLAQLLGGAVLVVGLYPLARGLAARPLMRAAMIAAFLLFALGANGLIEIKLFTHFADAGMASSIVVYVLLAALVGGAVGFCFGARGDTAGLATHALSSATRSMPSLLARVGAAWLAWPFIYFFFGMCVAPIVVPYYKAGIAGLQLPQSMAFLFGIQLIRSVLFLATSLPFIAYWRGSRRGLWLALGMAHAFTIGLYGLIGTTFFPMVLRIAHSAEITCDSFAYAGLLVLLFSAAAKKSGVSSEAAPVFASAAPATK
ncbi:MAG TPA: hypothetical protein VL986_01855 [Terracidiphilus sp.]|nr:hypothetical protein [Terracidiphilus sp.]